MLQKKLAVGAAFAALTASSPVALATDVFGLEGIGAVSRAMGGTAVTQDVGPGGMLTNPATLSLEKDGSEAMIGLDLVTTDIDVRNKTTGETARSGSHGNNRGPYFAPEVAYTQRIGDLAFGIGAFARGGLGTEYGKNSFLSRGMGGTDTGLENSSRLLVLDIPLAASYRVNEDFTVGASLDAMWQGLNLDLFLRTDQVGALMNDQRVSGTLVAPLVGMLTNPDVGLQGAHFSLSKNSPLGSGVDAWGYSGRLGMLYRVSPETRVGASYQFESQMSDMTGDAVLTAVAGDGSQMPFAGRIRIIDFRMPAKLDIGVSHRLTPQWSIAADLSRVFWKDVMKDIKVAFVANGGGDLSIQLPQNYRDQTILALGTSYVLSPAWTLRAGFRFATQALRGDTLFAVIPATPTKHLSLGFSYMLTPASRIDFAYSHAFREKMDNPGTPNAADPIEVKHSQNNATINYTVSF